MVFRAIGLAAVALLAAASVAEAQAAAAVETHTADEARSVEVERLPIDLSRIQRKLRDAERMDGGLNLRYTIDVFGQAPPLILMTPRDNVRWGPAPYGAPTHQELMHIVTPQQFRSPMMDFSSLIRWLNAQRRQDREERSR